MTSLFLLPISLLAYSTLTLAQRSSSIPISSTPTSFPAAASTTITTTLNSTTVEWPVATIFLPIDVPSNLAASIITAAPDRTAYAIGCLDHYSIPDTDNDCDFGTSFVLTEGVSTLIYTLTYEDDSDTAAGATIHCDLRGGTRATAATCTGHSAIDGLGTVVRTSTLASSQLSYAAITITAGAGKLQTANFDASRTTTNTSTGGAAAVSTGMVDVRWIGAGLAVGVGAVIGVL